MVCWSLSVLPGHFVPHFQPVERLVKTPPNTTKHVLRIDMVPINNFFPCGRVIHGRGYPRQAAVAQKVPLSRHLLIFNGTEVIPLH